ncbi:hypothetical protein [Faecalibacter bovis]|uniref:Uncharacterized protein n=1 Tax=Faecalibacter bovis TaxID=2898187 RepID=A0ABX7XBT3_9FLAO|nr:hypothetical protein [Faecalibacter bovis]MBS7334321.1 hypothetical protein [Weeksellaceae bacterium]QTV05381.1 hypothetical protein J9309_11475 [Faecalibacter bovis]
MKKTFLFLSACAIYTCTNVSAQVGIGTNLPQTTLVIAGKPNVANVADGVIAPKISK